MQYSALLVELELDVKSPVAPHCSIYLGNLKCIIVPAWICAR